MLTSTFTPTPLSTTGASSARWTAPATLPAPPSGQRAGQHCELVVSHARDEGDVVEVVLQAAGHGAQQLVAGLASERVVDLLEAFDVGDQDGAGIRPPCPQGHLEPLAVQRPVGQTREPVIASEAIVLARLLTQPARGAGHDPIQHQPQQQQPSGDHQRDLFAVARDRTCHGPVAEIHLERPRRAAGRGEPQRHVDLDQRSQADLAGRLRMRGRVHDHRFSGVPLQCVLEIVARLQRAADEAVVVRVDDRVPRVPELDPGEVLFDRRRTQLVVEIADLDRAEPVADLAWRQSRLDADVRDQASCPRLLRERPSEHLRLQNACEHESQARPSGSSSEGRPAVSA